MKLQVLASALALSLGAAVLAPVAAQADDGRGRRGSGRDYTRSYRDDRSRSYSSRSYRDSRYSRSYRDSRYYGSRYRYGSRAYRGYRSYPRYYYDDYYYGGSYAPYYRPPVVVPYGYGYGYRGYGYRGYRPLLGVRVGGPHFGVWLGF